MERVFRRQGRKCFNLSGEGTGLGLSLSYDIITKGYGVMWHRHIPRLFSLLYISEKAGKAVRTKYLPLRKALFRMENAIHTLRIQNFKSIKDVTLQPRRVNLIIGQPNVGKSNILEAMSLLGGMFFDDEESKLMQGQIRYEDLRNLFYDNDWSKNVAIYSNKEAAWLHKEGQKVQVSFRSSYLDEQSAVSMGAEVIAHLLKQESKTAYADGKEPTIYLATYNLNGTERKVDAVDKQSVWTRKYSFIKHFEVGASYHDTYLRPPHGDNMLDVLQYNGSKLRKEIADLFKPYGLNFAVRVADRKFEIQKNVDGYVYDYPYSLIADTLQRIIFYLAAIESNDDSVLLFEEPEAHTFPVYTSMLGRKIAASRNNQFFVATHSPYLVTEILEQMLPDDNQAGELAIFLAYYEDYQTKVKQLSDEEIRDIRGDSVDIFYNMARYTPRPANG